MAKQSPLSALHQADGAVFTEHDGWLLPRHFGDVAAEYAAVRSAVGLIDRCHRGLLQITGPDRFSYLQGMLSNDLREIKPGEGQPAAILNQQGKVLGEIRVLCSESSFYLDLWDVIKEKIVQHLNRYLVADEVEIADRSEEYKILSLQGPQAKALLQKLTGGRELPERPAHHVIAEFRAVQICVVQASHTGEPGFDLIVPLHVLQDLARSATDSGKEFSAAWIGEEAQNTLRVEAGIPRYGIDFSEDNLLLETGLINAVSFTKGCYLGQEIIERIRSRGHVNKKLMGLLLDSRSPVPSGASILAADKEAGNVTSSIYSPKLGRAIALGYIHKDFWHPGTKLSIKNTGAPIAATVAETPFVRATGATESSS